MANIVINKGQQGQYMQLHVGDTLEIQLPENGTTGFTWQLAPHPAWQVSRSFAPGANLPGAGGTASFVLKLLQKLPVTSVRLELRRPWESDEPPADHFDIRLSVV